MSEEAALWLGQEALVTSLLIAGPMLLAVLVVGSVVSVLQTVTQVQEATLVFVPKILAVFLVLGLMGAWMLDLTVAYATDSFLSISEE
jgi:flagellar biosynthetic protein FliQ